MKFVKLMLVVVAGLLCQACTPSCTDVCEHLADCNQKLDPSSPKATDADIKKCADSCETEFKKCKDESKFKSCLNDVQCDTQQQAFAGLIGCFSDCPEALNTGN